MDVARSTDCALKPALELLTSVATAVMARKMLLM